MPHLLAIDQGTTSTRAMLFDAAARPLAVHAVPLRQIFPANGWVEHDAAEIWQATLAACRKVLAGAPSIAAIGVTNQRETTLVWDRATGRPLHNAIVWQDRRTAPRCAALKAKGWDRKIAAKTGLLLDPYFSATKLEWLLGHIPESKARARQGEILFGTIDTWLVWNLTGGKVHATDVSNASRTMLLNLKSLDWDEELLKLFGVPRAMLPEVRDSAGDFGTTELFGGAIPILGVAGDQQAASIGQACFAPGDVKSTYGTGCFVLVNTGTAIPKSRNRLLATALYRRGAHKAYAIEGSIFIAGAVVQWLRDAAGMIDSAEAIEALAVKAQPAEGLYFVPAFTGLGAPYWRPNARGAITGLTRDMGKAEIARAALDAVCYQTRDLLEAMARDMKAAGLTKLRRLKVDGGMVKNDWFCQRLADLTGLAVERPVVTETTALGAAYLAGLGAGLFRHEKDIAARWALDRRFTPRMKKGKRDKLYGGWKRAIKQLGPI
jgi:glycerol kinase